MRKFVSLVISLIFCLPMAVSADNLQKEMIKKRVIIKTKGDAEESHVSKVLEWVESESFDGESTDHENVEVFVTVDDDGEVMSHAFHKVIGGKGVAHAKAYTDSIRPPHHQRPMSPDAANCILKNISKINSDAAAHLLKQACKALNPIAH